TREATATCSRIARSRSVSTILLIMVVILRYRIVHADPDSLLPLCGGQAHSRFAARSNPIITLVIPAKPLMSRLAENARDDARMMGQKARAPTATMPRRLPRPKDKRETTAAAGEGTTTPGRAAPAPRAATPGR